MKHFIFEKARTHKYIKRLGVPKHYIYTYAEPSGTGDYEGKTLRELELLHLQLFRRALGEVAGSPRQLKVKAELDKVWDQIGALRLQGVKEESGKYGREKYEALRDQKKDRPGRYPETKEEKIRAEYEPDYERVEEEPGVYTAEKKPKEMTAEERLKWAHRKIHHDVGVTVGGAKKEKYAEVNANNLSQLEAEGMKEAYSWVTKDSVFPKMNWDTEKAMGVSAGAAYFKKQLIGAINQRPPDSPQMREAFVHSQRFLSDSLVHCKSVVDVQDFIMEFAQLANKKKFDKMVPDAEFQELMVTPSSAGPEVVGSRTYHSVDTAIKKLYGEDPTKGPGYKRSGVVAEQTADRKNWKMYIPSDDPTPYADYLKSFGEKFDQKIVRAYLLGLGWGSRGHVSTFWSKDKRIAQEYEKSDNWSWTGKKTLAEPKKKRFEWERSVEQVVQRTGGQDIPEHTTADDIRKNFNLRAVEYGNWINDVDANYHINQAWGALSDLADVLGVDPKDTSLNGRLALAIGARGSGKARAHYEPLKKIVNLTKFSGGGCLAHEWGHAFDNVIAEASLISPSGKRWNFSEGVKSSDVKPETQNVMNAFNNVMDVMTKGDPVAIKEYLTKENNHVHELKMKYYAEKEPIAKEKIRTEINESIKNYRRVAKQRLSNYAQTAHILGTYWERPCELFARAFESYVEDKLDSSNRKSTYLVSGTKSPYNIKIEGFEGLMEPYPRGEERKKINLAMDALMERIRNNASLKKALNEMFYVTLKKANTGKEV